MYSVYSVCSVYSLYSVYSVYSVYSLYNRVIPCIPCIPCIPGITGYPRVFPGIPVFPVLPGIPGYPGIPGITGIPVYSRVSRVFPCITGIPVYSRVFRVFPSTARPARPLSPEGHSEPRGASRSPPGQCRGGVRWWGTPWTCPWGMSRGVHHPRTTTPALSEACSVPHRAAGMALWAQVASRGPGGMGSRTPCGVRVPVSSVVLARLPDRPQGDLG